MKESFYPESLTFEFEATTPFGLLGVYFDQGAQGVIIGHQHGVADFHQWSVELVEQLPHWGVKTIYFEKSETWQPDWENYLKSGEYTQEWANDLAMTNLHWGGHEDRRPFLAKVREQPSLNLFFVDGPDDRATGRKLTDQIIAGDRDAHMFRNFRENPPQGKFIFIGGNNHAGLARFSYYNQRNALPFGARVAEKYQVKTVTTVGAPSYPATPIVKYFNQRLLAGAPPLALGWQQPGLPEEFRDLRFKDEYQDNPLYRHFFDGLIVFPHATYL